MADEPTTWEDAVWKTAKDLTDQNGVPELDPIWEDTQIRFFLDGIEGILEELLFYYNHPVQADRHLIDSGYRFWFGKMFKMAWTALYDLYCEDQDDIDAQWKILEKIVELLISKQHDYGHGNIDGFGINGVIIRSSDKVARLKNLFGRGREAANESAEDSFIDLVGYSIIAIMLLDGTFKLELSEPK